MSHHVKHPGALWATTGTEASHQLPLPVAIGGALVCTAVVGVLLSQINWTPALQGVDMLTHAVLVDAPVPPPPPPPKLPEIKKVVKEVSPLPQPRRPVPPAPAPAPTPVPVVQPAQVVEAEHPAPAAPAIATAPATQDRAPSMAPMVSAPPAVAPRPPQSGDIGVACPHQVKPETPRRAVIEEISGKVRARAVIENGVVKDVTILSGPKVFHAAVRAAMLKYKCVSSGPGEIQAEQDFLFELE